MACLCSCPIYRLHTHNALQSIIWAQLEYFWALICGFRVYKVLMLVMGWSGWQTQREGHWGLFLCNQIQKEWFCIQPPEWFSSDGETKQRLNCSCAFQLVSQTWQNYALALCPRVTLHFIFYLDFRFYQECKIGTLQLDKPVIGACGLLQLITIDVSSTLSTVWSGGASGAV